jgi:VanZ family protein
MNLFFSKYIKSIWPAIIWSAIIFALLATPSPRLPNEKLFPVPHLDKLIHAVLFLILVFLWGSYLKTKNNGLNGRSYLVWLAMAATIYGIILEFVQLYTGRDFDVWDMLADGAGAFACIFLFKKIGPGKNRGRNQN